MTLPSITLERKTLSNLEEALQKEWLITNGLGGYASSTILGINTRKYHGLLIAALHPPKDRRAFLTKLDEDLVIGNDVCRLGANEFQKGFFPQGYGFLTQFSVSPLPRYTYAVKDVEVEKTIFMAHAKNAVTVAYNILNRSNPDLTVKIFPMINWRSFHSATKKSNMPTTLIQGTDSNEIEFTFESPKSALIIRATSGRFITQPKWIEHLYLREEARRGESCLDDCYQPGYFEIRAEATENVKLAITAIADEDRHTARRTLHEIPSTMPEIESSYQTELRRYENVQTSLYNSHPTLPHSSWLNWLALATDTFIVKGNFDQKAVIAGYHWFEPWGRDTFISLPGLLLVTGRFEDARKIFLSFKKHCTQGLIPNFLPDQTDQPVYNTVDASLWYVNAILQYLKYTDDFKFVQTQLWETVKSIIENHVKGTLFNIHADSSGLLAHGPQLTWMDATANGEPVTPREGKAVEIQALWYNALKTAELLASKFKEEHEAAGFAKMAENCRRDFGTKFWSESRNSLFDVVGERASDGSLRPNQILAVALDFSMLDASRNERIVETVQRQLLTPYGLRTLEKNDARYIGRCAGTRADRDRAYHNGTAWPWLLGPFTTAFLRVKGNTSINRDYAWKALLAPLLTKQIITGLGTLSEIFDGDAPHNPRGCISQAWSVAEPFRAYVEDYLQIRPRHAREVPHELG